MFDPKQNRRTLNLYECLSLPLEPHHVFILHSNPSISNADILGATLALFIVNERKLKNSQGEKKRQIFRDIVELDCILYMQQIQRTYDLLFVIPSKTDKR